MAKTLSFTDTSPQTVKIGDTTTSFTLICGNDNVATDLTSATSITVKLGNASGYLKSATVDPTSLTDPTTGQVTINFNADLMTSLTAGSYAIEVWVVDNTGTSIYPSDGSTGFTITNNIQSANGSTITTITFDDFVEAMNKAASTIAKGDKGDKGDTGTVDNAGLISAPAFQSLQGQVNNSAVGTNLLTGTGYHTVTGTGSHVQGYLSDETIDDLLTLFKGLEGQTVTVSVDYEYSGFVAGGTSIYDGRLGWEVNILGDTNIYSGSWFHPNNDSGSGKVSLTFVVPKNIKGVTEGMGYIEFPGSGTGTISHLKLEKGSLATDWSANPADNATVTAVSKISQTVDGMQTDISKKIEQKDLNGYATETWTNNQINTTASGINGTISSVKDTVDTHTTNINDLQADSSSFKTQFTTVSGTLEKQSTDISTLQASAKSLSASFDSLSSDNQTNQHNISQLQASAETFNSTLLTVQQRVQDSSVGTNLYRDTRDFDNPDVWNSWGYWKKAEEKLNGLTVMAMSTDSDWAGLGQTLQAKKGEVYTLSVYARYESGTGNSSMLFQLWQAYNTDPSDVTISLNETWQRFTGTFTVTADGPIYARMERGTDNTNTLLIAGLKLERGSKATDYSVSPLDNATVTAVSSISQTIDSIQTTVRGKADQSQITQLSGLIEQKVSSTDFNNLSKNVELQTLDSADINNMKTNGHYFVHNLANTPIAGWVYVDVIGNGDDRIRQDVYQDVNNQHSYRRWVGSWWSDWSQGATESEITQLSDNINLRVEKDGVINAINVSNEGTSIYGNKLHITADTYIDNATIKSAMIDYIDAKKIKVGTLDATKVNIIHLNADNIAAGTIRGTNLTIGLNSGDVEFQAGRIHSADNAIDININSKYISVANSVNRVMLKNGEMQFVEPGTYDISSNPYLRISNTFGGQSTEGAAFVGRKYAVLANSDNLTGSGIFDITMGTETFSGFATGYGSGFLNKGWHMTKIGGAERGVVISGGKATSYRQYWSASPSIMVGATQTSTHSGGMHGSNIIMDCDYLYNFSTWMRTSSHAANVYVADDGAIVRASSASKYKTNIERSFETDMGERILEVPTAHWFDKAEVRKKTLDPQAPDPRRYFGMIADDLDDAGLTELVEYNDKGEVEGLMYDRIALTIIPIVRNYRDRITKLESEIKQLKEG